MDVNNSIENKFDPSNWPEELKKLENKRVIPKSDLYEGKLLEVERLSDTSLIESYRLKIYIPLILN